MELPSGVSAGFGANPKLPASHAVNTRECPHLLRGLSREPGATCACCGLVRGPDLIAIDRLINGNIVELGTQPE